MAKKAYFVSQKEGYGKSFVYVQDAEKIGGFCELGLDEIHGFAMSITREIVVPFSQGGFCNFSLQRSISDPVCRLHAESSP